MSTTEKLDGLYAIRYPDGRFYPGNGARVFTDPEYPKWLIASQRVPGKVVRLTEVTYEYVDGKGDPRNLGREE